MCASPQLTRWSGGMLVQHTTTPLKGCAGSMAGSLESRLRGESILWHVGSYVVLEAAFKTDYPVEGWVFSKKVVFVAVV